MLNPYIPKLVRVKKIKRQTLDTMLFTFEFIENNDKNNFSFIHGQFLMVGLLGKGEAAFDICSSAVDFLTFELSIRKAGFLTQELHKLKIGDKATVRGPFGNGLPLKNFKDKSLLLIGGGCGFVTVRSFVMDYLKGSLGVKNLNVFYGCATEENLLFKDEYPKWRKKVGLDIALSNSSKNWQGKRGMITELFNKGQDFTDTVALIVGPPIMYKFVIEELLSRGAEESDIYLSLERRMYCGIGVCQHCAIGPYYVCKDGPVFSWQQLKNIPNAI